MPYAMGMVMIQLAAFLVTLWLLRRFICRNSHHNILTLVVALAILGGSFYAVVLGLPITYGILLSVLAPIMMTVKFNREKAKAQKT